MSGQTLCLACAAPLTRTFLDLGRQPLANALVPPERADAPDPVYPLHARVCDACRLVQVERLIEPQEIFADYPYFSSYSDTWNAHCDRLAGDMAARLALSAGSRVVEVGSNDGALLACFAHRSIPALGVEPASNVAKAALDRGFATDIAFFGAATARRLAASGWEADLIVATNVLGQAPDPNDFLAGVRALLKPDGLFAVEFPHLLNLIREVQFDTIYHEHFSYLSLTALAPLFARNGLVTVAVERLPVHGGSLRVLASRAGSRHPVGGSVAEVVGAEKSAGLDRPEGYQGFAGRVEAVREGFAAFLAAARAEGRTIVGYGAAAKGNTFLNHVGAGPKDIAFVVDRNPAKQGRLLPGSHIPVKPVEALAEARPDYVLILPWNLRDEVISQLASVRAWGGKFVTAVPKIEVIS